jgi:hypothetical protein
MKISAMVSSKYLKKEDCDPPRLLTFRAFKKENVAKDNEPADTKYVAYFDGEERGLVLNKTNLKRAAAALKSDDTDDWLGKQIVLYFDENVEFGGELVGGIRLRGPKVQAASGTPTPAKATDAFDDDIPF